MIVYILWSSDSENPHIEEIFANKIDAETLMRNCKEYDKNHGRSYIYWIQSREVHL
jgi:hypothetical protein